MYQPLGLTIYRFAKVFLKKEFAEYKGLHLKSTRRSSEVVGFTLLLGTIMLSRFIFLKKGKEKNVGDSKKQRSSRMQNEDVKNLRI